MKKTSILACISLMCLLACRSKQAADLLVYHATIYTVDSAFHVTEAMVIKDGKVLATGRQDSLEKIYDAQERLDAGGKYIYPGFIDAHAHFVAYGAGLQEVNLTGTGSWDEVLNILKQKAGNTDTSWLTGRGWDQNDWPQKEFPDNSKLNALFPNRPVYLVRVDGHAAIVNQKALELAGIRQAVKVEGGEIQTANGKLSGVLVDNAKELVSSIIPKEDKDQLKKQVLDAQAHCFAAGLTTVDDCGLNFNTIQQLREFQELGDLKIRIYAMLSDEAENYDFAHKTGMILTDRLTVRAFKVYGDGALGSRGACLLQPYSDKPGHSGFLLSTRAHFDSVAGWLKTNGWQMCTHAIGDSGNRVILDVYARQLGGKNDLRWRIEHAQVVSEADFGRFGKYSIIPSVQPTHATSDMYWAQDRLGPVRIKGAYAYEQLLNENGWLPLGTDFPVEDISPLKTFYAAVVRKDAKGWPANGFQTENALTREQAIRGMTIWAARANFEEQQKGSLEPGKWADFILLDQNLMEASPEKILQTKVLRTYVNGESVFQLK